MTKDGRRDTLCRQFFGPARRIMNRLRYPQKLLLISLLMIVPLAIVMFLLFSEINRAVEFSRSEKFGTQYLRPLRTLLDHVAESRRLTRALARGHESVTPALRQLQRQVDDDIAVLRTVDDKLGTTLKTGRLPAAICKQWPPLRQTSDLEVAGDADRRHHEMLQQIRRLMSRVGDTSNLILGPDLDSYYLMDVALLQLPIAADLVAEVGPLEEQIAAADDVPSPEKLAELAALAVLIESRLEQVNVSLEHKAFLAENNPTQNLRPQLAAPLRACRMAVMDLLQRLPSESANSNARHGSQDAVLAARLAAGSILQLWDLTVSELDGLWQARVERLLRKKHKVILFSLAVMSIVL